MMSQNAAVVVWVKNSKSPQKIFKKTLISIERFFMPFLCRNVLFFFLDGVPLNSCAQD